MPVRIICIPYYQAGFRLVQSFAVLGGEGVLLVDSGLPGQAWRVERALAQHNRRLDEVRLLLLTHAHYDHAGSAAELARLSGAPIAIHASEAQRLSAGDGGLVSATSRRHRASAELINRLGRHRLFPAAHADLLLQGGESLADYGVDGTVLHSPGHTPGSLSLHLPALSALIAGDALTGGWWGGHLDPRRPNYPAYSEDAALLRASAAALLSLTPLPQWIYVGHGGPLDAAALRRRFGAQAFGDAPVYPHAL